ncbi:MAG: RAMP superfamily CRISPR-associated protein [Candidatus Lokiarchaeia archaeon]
MLKIRKIKRNSRILFDNNKHFYKLDAILSVVDNNYLFIGSLRDEIFQISKEELESICNSTKPFDLKIQEIQNLIDPMKSTTFLDGKPYIPGSTLKGMIRFNLEHAFKKDSKGEIYSCFIKQDNPGQKQKIKNFLEEFGYWPEIPISREEEITRFRQRSRDTPTDFCKVCDIFGNTNLASRVIFSDANALEYDVIKVEIEEDRFKDTKRVINANFMKEDKWVPSQFTFMINFNNATFEDLALLFIGMNLHKDGTMLLGMHKYSPKQNKDGELLVFGKIKLELTNAIRYSYNSKGFTEDKIEIEQFLSNVREKINDFNDILRNPI